LRDSNALFVLESLLAPLVVPPTALDRVDVRARSPRPADARATELTTARRIRAAGRADPHLAVGANSDGICWRVPTSPIQWERTTVRRFWRQFPTIALPT